MNRILIAENGKIRTYEDVELAEDIIDTKNKKDPWVVIDKLVNTWAKKAADDVKAVEINIGQYRESLKDKTYGQTPLGKDQERRFKLSFPYALMMMIRSVYKPDDLKMDDAFFDKFAERYPLFKVAEKN